MFEFKRRRPGGRVRASRPRSRLPCSRSATRSATSGELVRLGGRGSDARDRRAEGCDGEHQGRQARHRRQLPARDERQGACPRCRRAAGTSCCSPRRAGRRCRAATSPSTAARRTSGMSVPYDLTELHKAKLYDGWVVVRHVPKQKAAPIVMTT